MLLDYQSQSSDSGHTSKKGCGNVADTSNLEHQMRMGGDDIGTLSYEHEQKAIAYAPQNQLAFRVFVNRTPRVPSFCEPENCSH